MTGAVSAFAPPIALPGLMALHGQPGWLGRGTDLSHPRRAFAPASSDVQLLPPPRAFHLMASSLGKGHQGATAGFGGVGSRSTLPSSRSPSTVEWTCFGVGKRAGRRNVVVAASGEVAASEGGGAIEGGAEAAAEIAVDMVKVKNLAGGLWRSAWRSLGLQGVLTAISFLFLVCSAWLQALAPITSAASCGLYASAAALTIQVVSMVWTWGYTKAATRLELLLASGAGAGEARKEGSKGGGRLVGGKAAEAVRLCREVRRSMDVGVAITLVGALFALFAANQVMGLVTFRMLLQRGVDIEFWAHNPSVVLHLQDVVTVNGALISLLAHCLGLLLSQRARRHFP
ncbi:hypothetical protein T484DRAFT_1942509 [Baffinella frigidus]|nr:hypothetical protein T484DRAFT_1942509 [Cryptophyta sp. CCMP2293]